MRARRVLVWIAAGVTAIACSAVTPAGAEQLESVRFHDSFTTVFKRFCGVKGVQLDFEDGGHFVTRLTGPNRLPKYSSTHQGSATYTNLSTGKTIFIEWSYSNSDVRLVDNGDGTFTATYHVPGPERVYGPDGELLYTSGGAMTLSALIDHGGTPSDPSDDVFISESLVMDNGGRPQEPFDFCESFRTLTA